MVSHRVATEYSYFKVASELIDQGYHFFGQPTYRIPGFHNQNYINVYEEYQGEKKILTISNNKLN